MAANDFVEILVGIFLGINPDPAVWVFILVALFVGATAVGRNPGTVAGFHAFLLADVIATSVGGNFDIFKILLIVALGVMIVLAWRKAGRG